MKRNVFLITLLMFATGVAWSESSIEGMPAPGHNLPDTATAPAKDEAEEALPTISFEGHPSVPVNLSARERALIEAKRDAIVQYLYERQELEGLREVLRDAEHEDAVDGHIRDQVPLTPEEIRMLRHALRDAAEAENAPLKSPPRLQLRTVDLDVDDQTPIKVHVAKGYSSSIVFFDETGAPWPLQSGVDALGDATAFAAQTVSEQGHVATFQILKEFSQSNALVILKELPVPVVLRLVGSDEAVDSRLSIRVPRPGPNAKVQAVFRNEVDNAPPDMLAFLNGETIAGGVPFRLEGVAGEVLKKGSEVFIRTRAALLSPAPLRSLVSAAGYNVYTLPPITHLLFTVDGELREARIERLPLPTLAPPENVFSSAEAP